MKILLIASEAVPMVKVGGLADVVGALPKVLKTLGHDARLIIPQYADIASRFVVTPQIRQHRVNALFNDHQFDLNLIQAGSVPVYTLDNAFWFGTSEIYINELERFYIFSRAVFDMLPQIDWQPDIIHCHDWMTALVPMWARAANYPYRSLFTIHNLNYQGNFKDNPQIAECLKADWGVSPPGAPEVSQCYLAQAILWADEINTVSATYAREITTPEHGTGLDSLLRFRGDHLHGILNGLDDTVWDPLTDRYIRVNYQSTSIELKSVNKTALQNDLGLPVDPEIPLVGMVQRLDEQKGLDIFLEGIDNFLSQTPVQIVLQGKGRADFQDRLRQIALSYPSRMSVNLAFEESLAHRVYAGCDMFLMPSRFEPCGLGQMIAMRYGAIPVVRHTGGLVDSVQAFNLEMTRGRGFVFHDYTATALFMTLKTALERYYNNRKLWGAAAARLASVDLSWNTSALQYERLYRGLASEARP